ncbi:MAG TPA: leucine-rich repeat domain-containing protein [Spirochaetales bacterium]|nr:leucine-rich repeat domain-containing protein [Spirochaetales bacterium]HRY54563.1 leucine-rich repeat domain-containing protein [Spirochaetia bacterium]HRZ65362.1 leucine-rich repeat domain-containing protein [Spirochaetia bacterium]
MHRASTRIFPIAAALILILVLAFAACSNPASGGDEGGGGSYSVTYYANGAAGEVPVDGAGYAEGASVPVKGAGSLVKGTEQFAGWTTSLSAAGRSCAAGSTIKMAAGGLSLYAVWIPSGLSFASSAWGIELRDCGSAAGAVTVPEGVTAIGYGAFYSSTMTGISLPPTLTTIAGSAFAGCAQLSSIVLPSSLQRLEGGAFNDCGALASLSVPARTTYIGSYAFYGCRALAAIEVDPANPSYASIDGVLFDKAGATLICYPAGKTATAYAIPSTVKSILGDAFAYESSLETIAMPSGLTTIEGNAFRYCTGLASATVPASVSSITGAPFVMCSKLDFAVESSSPYYVVTGGVLLSADGKTLVQYPEKAGAASYAVPDGVVDIAGQAFVYCSKLASLTLPSSLASFGWASFFGCSSLATVYAQAASPPNARGADPFPSVASLTIHVPSGSLAAYQAAEGWNNPKHSLVSP